MIRKFDKNLVCPKCSFRPIHLQAWKLELKVPTTHAVKCYGVGCDWDDPDVKEHIHQTCPVCSYMIACATADYEKQKGNTWSTGATETVVSAAGHSVAKPVAASTLPAVRTVSPAPVAGPRVIGAARSTPASRIPAANAVVKPLRDPWTIDCPQCPETARKLALQAKGNDAALPVAVAPAADATPTVVQKDEPYSEV